jgi:hypothetical protein
MLEIDVNLTHFFPPFFLIALLDKSPYHTTFGPVIQTFPNITGIVLPCSAVGTVKSPIEEGFGWGGFGASIALTKTLTTNKANCTQKATAPLSFKTL